MKPTPESDDLVVFNERRGVGVRTAATTMLAYELVVFAADVTDVVRSAGGWLCDRVRAGWQVTVLVPEACDTQPLRVLGVNAMPVSREAQARWLHEARPAALAFAGELLRVDESARPNVLKMLEGRTTEVSVWGDCGACGLPDHVQPMQHRLSPAARAFKSQALLLASLGDSCTTSEDFHSSSVWYPPDGADLMPVSYEGRQ